MDYPKRPINTLKRSPRKASYQQADVHAILDASEICHIAFNFQGKPFVQPINFGRCGEKLYIHGAKANRMTTAILEAKEVCLNVMLLDALKLTRSAYHHSVNYRSVMVFGKVRELIESGEKLHGLKTIINHFVPHRWDHCRHPNEKELKVTRVLEISIDTASAKIATAPPNDKEEDLNTDFWAGTIPVYSAFGRPSPVESLKEGIELPNHVKELVDKGRK